MNTTTATRKALHAYVSDDAHEKWHDFAASNGVSVSAILEALAPELRDPDNPNPVGGQLVSVVNEARRTDAQRRRRRRS